jgi:hypothetical protein
MTGREALALDRVMVATATIYGRQTLQPCGLSWFPAFAGMTAGLAPNAAPRHGRP